MTDINLILIDFFEKTWMAWLLALIVLNGLARVTKQKWDEKLVRIIVEGVTAFIPRFEGLIYKEEEPKTSNKVTLPLNRK